MAGKPMIHQGEISGVVQERAIKARDLALTFFFFLIANKPCTVGVNHLASYGAQQGVRVKRGVIRTTRAII
jgi:hypothetical protein